jgi:hypothetical protein
MVDLLVLACLDQLIFIFEIIFTSVSKGSNSLRRSTEGEDLLVLTCLEQPIFILKILFIYFCYKTL